MFLGCVLPVWPGHPCLVAVIVEALHYVEEKHAQDVRSFHVVRIFHFRAAGTNAARPANCGIQDSPGQILPAESARGVVITAPAWFHREPATHTRALN